MATNNINLDGLSNTQLLGLVQQMLSNGGEGKISSPSAPLVVEANVGGKSGKMTMEATGVNPAMARNENAKVAVARTTAGVRVAPVGGETADAKAMRLQIEALKAENAALTGKTAPDAVVESPAARAMREQIAELKAEQARLQAGAATTRASKTSGTGSRLQVTPSGKFAIAKTAGKADSFDVVTAFGLQNVETLANGGYEGRDIQIGITVHPEGHAKAQYNGNVTIFGWHRTADTYTAKTLLEFCDMADAIRVYLSENFE